jgi:hypothetical protein
MKLLGRFKQAGISPIPARTIADLDLEERSYKPDFEITARYQAFSKELVRISLLGLGVYGILIKMTTDEHGSRFLDALREHRTVAGAGVAAFAVCAGCALFHGFLATKCLGHQLVIARYFGRLEGARWSERYHELFRDIIRRQQQRQKLVLRAGNLLLWISTIALTSGAVCAASCFALVIFNK